MSSWLVSKILRAALNGRVSRHHQRTMRSATQRPRGLVGLTLMAARLTLGWRSALALTLALGALASPWKSCRGRDPLRVATFNIENYPKAQSQRDGAFEIIRSMSVSAVAVQEITDPGDFARTAAQRLGDSWRFAYPAVGPAQRVGVLYDSAALTLTGTTVHRECETFRGARPAFEARFVDRDGEAVGLMVLHLRAGSTGQAQRAEQLRALAPAITEGMRSISRFVVLGDFNATGARDRDAIASLARETRARWSSERLVCTSYWARPDACVTSALDQVLANREARSIEALGPCESLGCGSRALCPRFHREVSDHCPVRVAF